MRNLILGTAGHVDHGKTELIKALTGRDTDRLKEEKERGISIELGFAPLALDEKTFLGIVDVPGHERFVKHMVAGATGIDMVMLLVAADEGVMPQTEEHMEVLRSLAIESGVVVISKTDLGSGDTSEILREEIDELTRGTFLQGAPVVETSAKRGDGIDHLKKVIGELASGIPSRDVTGPFRQPVDRVFHKKGIGVVITGSCYSGSIKNGDTLEVLPQGLTARVRELQSFNNKRGEGRVGERLAIALQGMKIDEVARGDMLVTPGYFAATNVVDARISLAEYYDFSIKNRERLRLHHGAREVLGRVVLLNCDVLHAGDNALVQIKLEKPIVPAEGDRFILRKYSPARVIGGGVVIDPSPAPHKRGDAVVIEQLELKEHGDPLDILSKAVERAGLEGSPKKNNDADLLGQLEERGDIVVIEKVVFHRATLVSLAERVEDLAGEHQARFPLQWGMDKEELRQKSGFPHAAPLFNKVLEKLGTYRPIFMKGARVRSGEAEQVLSESAKQELLELGEKIRSAGTSFPAKATLETEWKGAHRFADVVQNLRDGDDVFEVGEGLIHREALERCIETIRSLFEESREISVSDVKNALGLTRKHTIPLLEMMDARRITRREGNNRVKGPGFPE